MTAPRTLSFSTFLSFMCATAILTGCSESSLNPFGKPNQKAVEGDRVTIINIQNDLEISDSMAEVTIDVPAASKPSSWLQEGGNPSHHTDNIDLSVTLSSQDSSKSGDGNAWQGSLIAAPVVSATHIFTMDGEGVIRASTIEDISHTLWNTPISKKLNSALNGGGLAVESNTVFATSANGQVAALSATDGTPIWRISLDMPIRSAPLITPDSLIVITTGSQLFALDKQTGQIMWRHRGIQETASLLGTVTPAYADGIVVAVYPSGEVYALSSSDGKPLWSDSMLLPERTSALGTFSGVGGMPVIAGDAVYSVSSNGLLIANQLKTGLRMWEQPLSSTNTPWIAGDYLYALSTAGNLIAADRMDGRIKWVSMLPDYQADDEHAPTLKGPYMVGGSLLIMRSDGIWQQFDPNTGTLTKDNDLSSGALSAPAFTTSSVLVANQQATLYSIH
jgi:outer membrane protein assembly factor BamB